jgi:hypothetical protein
MCLQYETFIDNFKDIVDKLTTKYPTIQKKLFTKLKTYKTYNSIYRYLKIIFTNSSDDEIQLNDKIIEYNNILYSFYPNVELKNKIQIMVDYLKSKNINLDHLKQERIYYELQNYIDSEKINSNKYLCFLNYDNENILYDLGCITEFKNLFNTTFNEYLIDNQEEKYIEEVKNINDFDKVKQPSNLKIKLFNHQLTSIHNLEQFELNEGVSKGDYHLNSRVCVLADKPGAGKSLSIVGWLTRYKTINNIDTQTQDKIKKYCIEFDVKYVNKNQAINDIKNKIKYWDITKPYIVKENNFIDSYHLFHAYKLNKYTKLDCDLIVCSSSIMKQWEDELDKSNLSYCSITKNSDTKDLNPNDYDVILVTDKMYNSFVVSYNKIAWRRFIYDEASSVHIPSMKYLVAGFYVFITATYDSLLGFKSCRNGHLIRTIFDKISYNLLDMLLIKNPDYYIDSSCKVGEPEYITHKCKNNNLLGVVEDYVDAEVKAMLEVGDIQGAIEKIGGKNCNNFVDVLKNKKLEELKDAEYKMNKYKNKPDSKPLYDKWVETVNKLNTQIKNIEERFKDVLNDDCPVCYEELKTNTPVMMPCCNYVYCANCIVKLIALGDKCPSCRSDIIKSNLIYLSNTTKVKQVEDKQPEVKERELKNKLETLVDIILDNPEGRYILFSDFESSVKSIKTILAENDLQLVEIKGTKATREKNIQKYKDGECNIMFLNSKFNGSGINLQCTTDIILYHTMNEDIKKQAIGRVKRIGKDTNFKIHEFVEE